jgi:hypothetical protein
MNNNHRLTTMESNTPSTHLEPRVAKLEVGLDRLTEDVRNLAGIVRDQGANVEKQLQSLTVSVTQAQAPRKTDWSVIISGGLLIMALGSAVFWPLNQTEQNNKDAIDRLTVKFEHHEALPTHPVGEALTQRLETRVNILEEQFRHDAERDKDELQALRDKSLGLNIPAVTK